MHRINDFDIKGNRILAEDLFRCGAVKFGEFRLKLHKTNPDAPLSPVYVDLRILRSFPWVMRRIRDLLCDVILMRSIKPKLIADIPTAATPIVTLLSEELNIPMISPRLDGKSHGAGARIEGVAPAGVRVLLVDDVLTGAETKIAAATVLREEGLKVRNVLVLIDREQGGREELKRRGMRLHAVFTLRGLLGYYLRKRLIEEDQYSRVMAYLNG